MENSILFFFFETFPKGRGKKNLEFFRFSLTHPPPKNGQNLEKKIKFYSPKMIFRQFWAVWEFFLSFHPIRWCILRLAEWWLVWPTWWLVRLTWLGCRRHNAQCGQHNAWCCWHDGTEGQTLPPYMEKNKLPLNQYLGIFNHLESIFL